MSENWEARLDITRILEEENEYHIKSDQGAQSL